ncbi:MAG TPA: hypothetical protein VMF31_14320 [Solirubrobacterales bacterium]|nr:hypothetical protein [Solirubrobacterales bacterium]
MSDSNQIIEPTETIQLPAPSWGPALLAFGILGLLAGVFATGFMFPSWWYAAVGAIFVIAAIRSMAKKGTRAYYSLPREQGDVRSELPVESFSAPTHE